MGKTNLHELSGGWTSQSAAFGQILNPYNKTRVPGGSSGGSAAAVASRMAPLAIAADTFGSIRVPASFCGVVGLRPGFGRYPNAGIMSLTLDKFDQVGPLVRDVKDLVLFDEAVTGDPPLPTRPLSSLRVGISPAYFLSGLDVDVERVTLDAIDRLRRGGATVVSVDMPDVIWDSLATVSVLISYESRLSVAAYLEEYETGVAFSELVRRLGPRMRALFEKSPPPHAEYLTALRKRDQVRAEVAQYFAALALDVVLFPSTRTYAVPLGDPMEVEIRGVRVSIFQALGRNIALGSLASLPCLVLPAGVSSCGLPIGLEFVAPSGRDRELMAAGSALQTALGTVPLPLTPVDRS